MESAIQSIIQERTRQDAKWGQQNHEPMAWMGILGEEFGELCEAVNETHFNNGPEARKKGGYENMRAEAVQVAAVAVSFIEALDRRYGRDQS
jgi:NTP pyrophosphatase (non-canonical NTP hydrolase)